MAHPSNIPEWDAYNMSKLPSGASIPDGNFLLPVCTNKKRLQSILNALSSYGASWDWKEKRDIEHLIDILEAINHINECVVCGEVSPPDDCAGCTAYEPDQRLIEWQPGDPFRKPDYIPAGYNVPPWSVSGSGTVKTDLLSLPTNIVDIILAGDFDGFPRLKINFSGAGKVHLYLEQVPLGGLALITLDGDPLSAEIVDLSSLDLLALADYIALLESITGDEIEGGLNALRIVEVNATGTGDHYIDITMLPKISSDSILGFGGGFRKVELCGQAIEGELPEPPPAQPPQLRQTGDCIEWLNPDTGEWECLLTVTSSVAAADCDCDESLDECGDCDECQECEDW